MNHITTEPLNPNACMKKTETNEDQKSLLQSFYSISVFELPPLFNKRGHGGRAVNVVAWIHSDGRSHMYW